MISEATLLDHTCDGFRPTLPAPARKTPDQVRYEYIRSVLDSTGGNISETARQLGMHRRSLQRIMATRWPFLREAA